MNKKAKKRAFFVCATIFIMYVMVGLGFTEKLSMKRITASEEIVPSSMSMSIPKAAPRSEVERPAPAAPVAAPEKDLVASPSPEPERARDVPALNVVVDAPPPKSPAPKAATAEVPTGSVRGEPTMEPSLFIAIPIVLYAIKEGLIEKEGLILTRKEGYNNSSWKKPLDILKDKDQEGLKSVSKTIGKKQIYGFLRKEGITHVQDDGADDVILGKGYGVEKKKLLGLYDKYVSADYQKLFPFYVDGVGVVKGKNGFEFVRAAGASKDRQDREGAEWMMPNLSNLTIRDAIEKLSTRTAKIKVRGSGSVTDQEPKPFQRVNGETECTIYGRVSR
jgi:hypothetical protein